MTATAPQDSPLDVLIVGAGLSGIGAARQLQQRCPGKRYAILEARASMGGTWDLFRYPGIRSDSDMYTLGYRFKPWKGAKAIADGPSILSYIRETADEAGITRHIRFGHKVIRADWDSGAACWTVEAERAADGSRVQWRARLLYVCAGYYSYAEGHRPAFAGEENFRGRMVHPQFWDPSIDYAGKRVVVIGSGATAVTLVPAMAQSAAHVTMLQRSPTYIVARPGQDAIAHKLRRLLPEGLAYGITRWKNVLLGMFFFQLARRRPEQVKLRMVGMAAEQLGPGVDVGTHFTPRYKPWDQRVCLVPDGDLFRELRDGRASVVTDTIARFTEHGIQLDSGKELAADVVVVATGLKLNMLGDIAITVDGQRRVPAESIAYKGMMLSDVPNMVLAFGYTNASWTLKADLTAEYVCRLLRYMDRHGRRIAVARRDGQVQAEPFLDFTSGYVQRAASVLPRQGDRKPWRVYQNYFMDMLTIRYGRIDDGVMQFDAPLGAQMQLKGRVAVLTGAGSGIGRALAQALALRGCHLALADRDRAGLEQTAALPELRQVRVSLHVLDVADREAVAALPVAVMAEHGRVDLLVNNAGVALGGSFEEVSESDFDWLMSINFQGVVRMTRAFLPLLRRSDDARIVNLSSLFGLISPPGQAAYSASKFAVRGFSNALRHELADSRIGVTVVHPGGIATSIARNARVAGDIPREQVEQRLKRTEKLLRMPPAKAADIILRGIEKRRSRVLVGSDAVVLSLLERLAPVRYWNLIGRSLQS
ncbi:MULTISPECIES: NAD(P)/FAD-dependent oxidoreductase [Cupriavidus]|uniref:NAD(P)/FAD-dependent oxidoreductase n=1 Tax=Cupriavidus TaxID=106589 RepID=UPI0009F530FD|nr:MULTISPECIES: NAD(P)/FAD-dependent oxidoreductase [Cupriavidus]